MIGICEVCLKTVSLKRDGVLRVHRYTIGLTCPGSGRTPLKHQMDADHRVITGDCLDPVTGLYSLPDKSIDVTIADPQYEEEAHTKQRRVRKSSVVDNPLEFPPITAEDRRAMALQIVRVTKRWALVFCQAEAVHLWRESLEAAGARYVRRGLWIKTDGQPQLTGDRPAQGDESIVIVYCSRGKMRWNGGGRPAIYHTSKSAHADNTDAQTPKPQRLMQPIVSDFSDAGELVLDPTCGQGSTGVACKARGRRFVGWEIRPAEAEKARRRIAGLDYEETAQLSLIGGVR